MKLGVRACAVAGLPELDAVGVGGAKRRRLLGDAAVATDVTEHRAGDARPHQRSGDAGVDGG